LQIGASSVLEVAADQGSADRISFVGAGGAMIVDDAGKFGVNVGASGYAGPRIANFAIGDSILLGNVAAAGLTPAYNAATGLLQIDNGSANVASLLFDTASLGAGVFQIANSGGHALLTEAAATAVHWVAGSGGFNAPANWNPAVVPVATIDAIIDAPGTFTVTASTSETMNSLAMAANATLLVSGGTFTVNNGSGVGGLAGNISASAGAVLALSGSVDNRGTIAGAGQLGDGQFTNAGTVNANASVGLTVDLGGRLGQNLAGALIEATAAGGLRIVGGTIANAGTMLAAGGSRLSFGSGVVNENNGAGVLLGGTWEASGGGTLAITGGAVTQDKATIILSGAGSVLSAGGGSTFTGLAASLVGVAPIGLLELDAGAALNAAHVVADFGRIVLGGGTLTARLAVGAIGSVRGYGTLATIGSPICNGGTIDADAAAALVVKPGGTLANAASGLVEATAAGGLSIGGGVVSNAGTLLAANGSRLAFAAGVANQNNNGGVLRGGTWEASGGGTLAVTGGAVTVDQAAIVLSGAGVVGQRGRRQHVHQPGREPDEHRAGRLARARGGRGVHGGAWAVRLGDDHARRRQADAAAARGRVARARAGGGHDHGHALRGLERWDDRGERRDARHCECGRSHEHRGVCAGRGLGAGDRGGSGRVGQDPVPRRE
jgi:hypothetical protein